MYLIFWFVISGMVSIEILADEKAKIYNVGSISPFSQVKKNRRERSISAIDATDAIYFTYRWDQSTKGRVKFPYIGVPKPGSFKDFYLP